jgi:hypothetical protein
LYENVKDVVLVDTEEAAEIGLQCEGTFDFQPLSCIIPRIRYVSKMCSYMKFEYRMQVLVCKLGEVAIIIFSPFLFWSTKLSKRIIINGYIKDRKIYANYILLMTYFTVHILDITFLFFI